MPPRCGSTAGQAYVALSRASAVDGLELLKPLDGQKVHRAPSISLFSVSTLSPGAPSPSPLCAILGLFLLSSCSLLVPMFAFLKEHTRLLEKPSCAC